MSKSKSITITINCGSVSTELVSIIKEIAGLHEFYEEVYLDVSEDCPEPSDVFEDCSEPSSPLKEFLGTKIPDLSDIRL